MSDQPQGPCPPHGADRLQRAGRRGRGEPRRFGAAISTRIEVATGRGDVLLVGHEPDFSRAIQAATGARVQLKKGALAAIEGGTLIALLGPAALRAIAACQ